MGYSQSISLLSYCILEEFDTKTCIFFYAFHSTRLDFRVPFPLFKDIVKDCRESNIFTTGKKKATICVEFKVLACLRILGRNYVTASETTINDFLKLFLRNYSRGYYKKYVFVHKVGYMICL